jgi:hypothetical protein
MKIIESWEDHNGNYYAIVSYSKRDQKLCHQKEYEAMWTMGNELYPFGGSVGYGISDFDTVEQAQDFLLKGIALEDTNPEIFLEMVEVR